LSLPNNKTDACTTHPTTNKGLQRTALQ